MNTVTRKLVGKELYVNRWLVAGGAVAAVLAVLVATTGSTGFNVGVLTWLTAIVALGVLLAVYGVANERKEHTLELVLSLPLSPGDYVRAKLLGMTLCFLLPWLVASAAALLLVLVHDGVPDGMLPYTVLLCGFLLANFSLVLAGTLHVRSEAAMGAVVIVTNMGVSLFMFTVGGLAGIGQHMAGPVPVWSSSFWAVLAAELAVLAIAFTLPLLVAARRRDFI
jgi:ABC-type transport system involved in multi-copper enzyme maturation permease subunit